MKNCALLVCILGSCCIANVYSFTSREAYNLVVEVVDRMLLSDEWNDCITEEDENSNEWIEIEYPTAISMFESLSNSVYSSWSMTERQNAFNFFLENVAKTNKAAISTIYSANIGYALLFCESKGYTNAVGPAELILRSPNAPCKEGALMVFMKYKPASIMKTQLVFSSITNKVDIQKTRRYTVLNDYVSELLKLPSQEYSVKTNAATLFYANRAAVENLMDVDRCVKAVYPTYSASSNRLMLSSTALARPNLTPIERAYFVSVTNELHSAAQPLAVVPGL